MNEPSVPAPWPLVDSEPGPDLLICRSRFDRLREGQKAPVNAGLIGMDIGYLKYAVFPGDAGIFSVTLAAAKDEPSPEDMYRIGSIANILQMLKLPDGTVKVSLRSPIVSER